MKPLAIDLFCGAGGMSEGILQAGFHIVFSSDKSIEASKTYINRHKQLGLINGENTCFKTIDIKDMTGKLVLDSISKLKLFKNKKDLKIDAIFGGPPCQSFSTAGLRKKDDPRNLLFKEYLRVISEVSPNYVVLENVVGILDIKLDGFISYSGEKYKDEVKITEILEKEFNELGYKIKNYGLKRDGNIDFKKLILDASDFGVPQKRKRMILLAYKKNMKEPSDISEFKSKEKISVKEALTDLIVDNKLRKKKMEELKKENKLRYIKDSISGRTPNFITGTPVSLSNKLQNIKLSKNFLHIKERFTLFREGESSKKVKDRIKEEGFENINKISSLIEITYTKAADIFNYSDISQYKKDLNNITMKNKEEKKNLLDLILSKKNIRIRLNSEEPSRTVVTLPDDYISPFENRFFSVREMARLQSFDDSFIFLGKRTTGGSKRKSEVPQYTQVGNAVPPLLAKAIAMSIKKVLK